MLVSSILLDIFLNAYHSVGDLHLESDESDKAQLKTLRDLISEEQKGYRDGNLIAENDFISIARQLIVYDPRVHKDLTKLPIMVMRQYVEVSLSYEDFAISPNESDASSEEPVIIAPTPLLRRDSNEIISEDSLFISEAIPRIKTISSKEWYRKDDEEPVPHLIVLQHGYMGCPADMKLIRDILTTILLDPTNVEDNVQVAELFIYYFFIHSDFFTGEL